MVMCCEHSGDNPNTARARGDICRFSFLRDDLYNSVELYSRTRNHGNKIRMFYSSYSTQI